MASVYFKIGHKTLIMLFTFVGCRRVAARRVIHQARTFAGADFDHLIPDHTRQAQSKRFKPPRPAPPPGGATLFVRKNFQGIPVPNEARDASKVWMKNAQNSAKAFADINPPNKYSGRLDLLCLNPTLSSYPQT